MLADYCRIIYVGGLLSLYNDGGLLSPFICWRTTVALYMLADYCRGGQFTSPRTTVTRTIDVAPFLSKVCDDCDLLYLWSVTSRVCYV